MSKGREGDDRLTYTALLGEYVKLSLERDRMRVQIDRGKASRAGEVANASRLVEILGAELRGDARYYLTWHDRGRQFTEIVNDMRRFFRASPTILAGLRSQRPPLTPSDSPHSSEAERALREAGGSSPSAETMP